LDIDHRTRNHTLSKLGELHMKSLISFLLVCSLTAIMAPTPAAAGEVTIPNTFQSGTPAVAAEVNDNFSAVVSAVDDNDGRIAALEAAVAALQATVTSQASTISTQASTITSLQSTLTSQAATISTLESELAAVQSSQVMALDPYLTVDETGDPRGPLVQLAGANLQIVNGLGSTDTINGLGNLIVGYDEVNTFLTISLTHCSDGDYGDQASCEDAGEVWSHSHKSGSHYLVAGSQNNYSQFGGIVTGYRNFATNGYSTVTGGTGNIARGRSSSVSGGALNTASGTYSSVSGGYDNMASNEYSSVSGGYRNTASGTYSSVSGGNTRSASGVSDWRAGNLIEDN
jgi:uncharacterized coiled-coil protein SlyX